MWARARSEAGFTTVELLLAVLISSVGVISLIGTFDLSRRVTSYSEMKEAASHVAEQTMEELRTVDYGDLALGGAPTPSSATDPNDPPYYIGSGGTTYRPDYDSPNTEPLVIDAADGAVPAAAEAWSDGRIGGQIYRYVTCAAATVEECDQGPDTTAYRRITVAVTVDTSLGPQKPILVSTLVGNPDTFNGEGANPDASPDTTCTGDFDGDGDTEQGPCSSDVDGTVSTWYLYDTPATFSARQEIVGSHATHSTVAPSGTCSGGNTSGCPVPDLMGMTPPPAPAVTPPVYNYSNEITGGTTPGGVVVRRDTTCNGTVTTTDNTKGHFWVTSPLAADMTLSGDAAMSLSTVTFNGATADALICVGFYNVPASISNLVADPPTLIGVAGYEHITNWPSTAKTLGIGLDFLDSAFGATIPAGNRMGIRLWTSSSSGTDLVFLYDHPNHQSFLQVNESNN